MTRDPDRFDPAITRPPEHPDLDLAADTAPEGAARSLLDLPRLTDNRGSDEGDTAASARATANRGTTHGAVGDRRNEQAEDLIAELLEAAGQVERARQANTDNPDEAQRGQELAGAVDRLRIALAIVERHPAAMQLAEDRGVSLDEVARDAEESGRDATGSDPRRSAEHAGELDRREAIEQEPEREPDRTQSSGLEI